MNNTIYLRRKRKVILPPGSGDLPVAYVGALLKNIEPLGFTFSPALIERVQTLSLPELSEFYAQLIEDLKQMVGAHVRFRPMYPNFPAQVMETSRAELHINALIHYVTLHLPVYGTKARLPLLDDVELRVIDLGDEDDFRQISLRLLNSKTSISATDKADLAWFVQAYRNDAQSILPDDIPLKENVAYVGALLIKHVPAADLILAKHIKTATDVLRLATAMSDGDVSLAANTTFRSFGRPERRLLLTLLEPCPNVAEDMLRHKKRWIRLGERIHPFEFKDRFPRSCEGFAVVRGNTPFHTFNSQVESALAKNDPLGATDLLRARPGDFARRLDHLLRLGQDQNKIVEQFGTVATSVSTPVLLQVLAHFAHRTNQPALRTFFPKGEVAKVQAIPNTLPRLSKDVCAAVVAVCRQTLIARFATRPPLGNVYIDERLRQYTVPFGQRSASKALHTIVRGSKLDMPRGNTIRFFLWWKEGIVGDKPTGRVDVDLSAVMYDAAWRYKEHISYTNLKSNTYNAAHSGDIVTAPNGACEFIDIDIPSVLRYGGRYVVPSLHSYTSQPYCNLPECFVGWMMRQAPNSGEVFEPATVENNIDLAADTRICIPAILDLLERKVIWADLALRSHPRWFNNVEGNQKGMLIMGQAITTLVKPTLYDLFDLHAAARGTLTSANDAEVVFATNKGITPFDIDVVVAEYL